MAQIGHILTFDVGDFARLLPLIPKTCSETRKADWNDCACTYLSGMSNYLFVLPDLWTVSYF